MVNRSSQVNAVVESIERDMELLCVTGVEDKLQLDVRPTLEMLGNAGVKVSFSLKVGGCLIRKLFVGPFTVASCKFLFKLF